MVFKILRGEGNSAKFVDYKTEVEEGMVVLDVVHRIQATQANDLAVRWNCKAGKCRIVLSRNKWQAPAHVHDADEPDRRCRTGHRRADAHLSACEGLGYRRFLELSREAADQEVRPAKAGRARWHLARSAVRC